jgi:hypothetical protein
MRVFRHPEGFEVARFRLARKLVRLYRVVCGEHSNTEQHCRLLSYLFSQNRSLSGTITKMSDPFSPNYATARDRFRRKVSAAGGRLAVLDLAAKGPDGETLSIDIGWFGAEASPRVLLHSSGLHGVEGFAGSAIQLQLLDTLPPVDNGKALVLVHILNPYGMAWLRRTNERNVDLNRNFLFGEPYAKAPAAYAQLDSFLNPKSAPSKDAFALRAALLIVRHGLTKLRQAVEEGQYESRRSVLWRHRYGRRSAKVSRLHSAPSGLGASGGRDRCSYRIG